MLYTPKIKQALQVCCEIHQGQFDKSGLPYAVRQSLVAAGMETEAEILTALLCDVLEEPGLGEEWLARQDYDREVLEAIRLLKKSKKQSWETYIQSLRTSPLACKVKIADLKQAREAESVCSEGKSSRFILEKYERALNILEA